MSPVLLRFSDLKARGIVNNWTTLRNWQKREGFPPGILLGPNSRAWPEDEIEAWLAESPRQERQAMTGIFFPPIVCWIGPPINTPITTISTGTPGHHQEARLMGWRDRYDVHPAADFLPHDAWR